MASPDRVTNITTFTYPTKLCIAYFYLFVFQVRLVNISNEDILSGNHKLTLGLIWTIICRYQFEVS